MSADDESPVVQECIDIVARFVAWQIFDPERASWEDYPEIGEYDWERVLRAVEVYTTIPPLRDTVASARKYLAKRAI